MGEGGKCKKEDMKKKNQNHKYIYDSLNINNTYNVRRCNNKILHIKKYQLKIKLINFAHASLHVPTSICANSPKTRMMTTMMKSTIYFKD